MFGSIVRILSNIDLKFKLGVIHPLVFVTGLTGLVSSTLVSCDSTAKIVTSVTSGAKSQNGITLSVDAVTLKTGETLQLTAKTSSSSGDTDVTNVGAWDVVEGADSISVNDSDKKGLITAGQTPGVGKISFTLQGKVAYLTTTTSNPSSTAPELQSLADLSLVDGVELSSISLVNTGLPVASCSVSPPLPSGLAISVVNSSCSFTGTPLVTQAQTTYKITATAENGKEASVEVRIAIVVASPPVIADAAAQTFLASTPISAVAFTNSGSTAVSCASSPTLPSGLSVGVSSGSCRITGTAQSIQTAATYTIIATAADGSKDTATVSITVNPSNPPIIANASAQTFVTTLAVTPLSFTNTGDAVVSCAITPSLPTGLSIAVNASTCRITGTPTASQSATTHTVTATAADGSQDTATVSVTVNAANPPALANASAQTYVTTVAVSALSFTNTGAAVVSCSDSPALPAGLSISVNGGTCRITGTPTASQGATVHTITATGADGTTDTADVTITVTTASPPVVANAAAQSYVTTVAVSALSFTNSGSAVTACSISPALPTGLSLGVNASTCRITGTPTATQTATIHTVTATAADGSQDTADVSITVSSASPPTIADAAAQSYVTTVAISALSFTNSGSAVTSCSVSPALPTGLSLGVNASTCRITGTATVTQAATTHTITATAADGSQDTASVSVTVVAANPPIIANAAAQTYVTTVAISALSFANTGAAVTGCSVSPALPTGLSVSVSASTCQITGTATSTQGATSHTVTGTAADGSTDTATVSITVNAASPPAIADASAQTYTTTVAISALSFTNSGSSAQACTVSPALPAGLALGTNVNTCRITGTPTAAQTATSHTVTATAADGSQDTATVSITVNTASPPNIANASAQSYSTGVAISALSFTNSGSAATSCASSPTLPTGLAVAVNSSTCRITGTPTAAQSATTHTITATAADGSTDTATVEITVVSAGITCPTNYVKVPANNDLGTAEFCVMKYEARVVGGIAVSQASGTPANYMLPRGDSTTPGSAIKLCLNEGPGYALISNNQWQAIARNIETAESGGVYLNWSNGSNTGNNFINMGHSDGSPNDGVYAYTLAAAADNAPCTGTEQTNCTDNTHADFSQKRTHTLSNGQVIWDFSGNVSEWVSDVDLNPGTDGSAGYVAAETWSGGATGKLKWGPSGSYTGKTTGLRGGLGYVYFNWGGAQRGGIGDGNAGIFSVTPSDPNGGSSIPNYDGFRCVYNGP